ncbi:cyclin-D5-1-like [Alnus glutinosa]|uniref:cyclin-D5-1-like n=1 Tax=Alnus glutinosa TaxID=3517 RepID=UPI002D776609|nr:cyclin-D5-1-like [Alnus glutinosa]
MDETTRTPGTPFSTPTSVLCNEGEARGTPFTPFSVLCNEDKAFLNMGETGTPFPPSSFLLCDEDEAFLNMDERTRRGDHSYTFLSPDLLCHGGVQTSLNNELYEAKTFMGLNLSFVSWDEDEHIQNLVQRESSTEFGISKSFVTSSCDHCSSKSQSWLEDARLESIEWIFMAREYYGFLYHTAYICVTYFDRFLSMLPIDDGELLAIRSLAVACLSLAAKMEDKKITGLSELSGYNFEREVTWKNELIVLEAFEWKMIPVTPFHYLHYFINKFCGVAIPPGELVSRAVELIMAAIKEVNLMDHRPSIIAASAVLRAIDGQLTKEQFQLKMNGVISLWGSIENEHVLSSYYMIENIAMGKVKTARPPGSSSIHSSLIGVIESSSHPLAVRIRRKLGLRPTKIKREAASHS